LRSRRLNSAPLDYTGWLGSAAWAAHWVPAHFLFPSSFSSFPSRPSPADKPSPHVSLSRILCGFPQIRCCFRAVRVRACGPSAPWWSSAGHRRHRLGFFILGETAASGSGASTRTRQGQSGGLGTDFNRKSAGASVEDHDGGEGPPAAEAPLGSPPSRAGQGSGDVQSSHTQGSSSTGHRGGTNTSRMETARRFGGGAEPGWGHGGGQKGHSAGCVDAR